jgi:ribosomal protein S12 methylthiotransferase
MRDKYKIGTSTPLSANGEHNRTIGILSLGCPRNLVDSENILGRLSLKGYSFVDIDKADIALVNTCAFIEEAKTESIAAILDLIDLKRKGKIKKIVVYGCLTQRYKDKLQKELPEVDAFVGKISLNHSLKAWRLTPKHYAYVKICEGCINNCSYCIIPKIKGKFASLDIDSILTKIKRFDKNKVSEVNIIGQDITGYGLDLYASARLPELLKNIIKKTKNIGWIRLLYLYPSRINDKLLELIKDEPRICKYIDLPLQHINDRILRLMRRNTTKKDILRLIDKIRKKIPNAVIRTSLIVGFPSETDKEFRELLDFIEEVRFERLGAFIYSREEGTMAYSLKGQIPAQMKRERFNTLMLQQQRISEGVNKKFLKAAIDVLIDEPSSCAQGLGEKEEGSYLGRSQYDAPEVDGLVYVDSKKTLKPGDFVRVEITDTLEYDLVGKV